MFDKLLFDIIGGLKDVLSPVLQQRQTVLPVLNILPVLLL